MSRSKARGTTPRFRESFPGGEVVTDLARQNMVLRKELENMAGVVNVTRTILAAVLSTQPDREVVISAATIAELEGRSFTIEKRHNEDGSLEVRADVHEIIEGEVVEDPLPEPPSEPPNR